MRTKYMTARNRRVENRTIAGRFRGGKLAPVMASPFMQSEGGIVSQSVNFELDPIGGRVITEMTAEVVSVFVPMLAIEALKNPDVEHPGNEEIFREKHLLNTPIFGLEAETEISKRLGVVPRSVNGVKYVSETARLAHNVAVNYLRRRKYVKASQILASNQAVTPALIAETVLDRFNGVLDPEDRINGAVMLEGKIPVRGLGVRGSAPHSGSVVTEAGGHTRGYGRVWTNNDDFPNDFLIEEDSGTPGVPNLFINFAEDGNQALSIQQFYQAERMDRLVREMRATVDANPEYGEDIVSRMAHGLQVEIGKQPFVLYQKEVVMGNGVVRAMDGANLDQLQTNGFATIDFTVPVPQTEFGGIVITFAALKPDEALAAQPHPILSDSWSGRNFLKDELALDPVPMGIRELNGDCAQSDENTVAMYIGNNEQYRRYVNYGFNRHLDTTTVQAKSAIWMLEIPLSVTPSTVIYPDDIDHYPFADSTAEVCQYTCSSQVVVQTPLIYGPTPVEELAAIETENVFED